MFRAPEAHNTGLAVHVMHGAQHERKAALRGVVLALVRDAETEPGNFLLRSLGKQIMI